MLSPDEIKKVNELYNKIDVLEAKASHADCHEAIIAKLDSIEAKLEEVACKCTPSVRKITSKTSTKK